MSFNPLSAITNDPDDLDFLDVQENQLVISRKRTTSETKRDENLEARITKIDDYLNSNAHLLTNYLDPINRRSLLNLIGKIHQYHAQCFREGKDVERKAEIEMIKFLLKQEIPDLSEELINELAVDQEIDIVEFLNLFSDSGGVGVSDDHTPIDKKKFIEIILGIPEPDRANVIKYASPLMRGIKFKNFYDYDKVEILSEISKISQKDRADVMKYAIPLMTGIESAVGRVTVLEGLANIAQPDLADVMEYALPLITVIESAVHIVAVLKGLANIPQIDRADVMKHAMPLDPKGILSNKSFTVGSKSSSYRARRFH